jgi:hypothetical protein
LNQVKLGFEDLFANHRCVMIVVMVELGGMVLGQNSFLIRVARPDDESFLNIWLYDSYSAGMVGFYDEGLLARALPLITKANPELLSSGRFFCCGITIWRIAGLRWLDAGKTGVQHGDRNAGAYPALCDPT